MFLQKHLIWAFYTTLFLQKSQLPFVPFVDPVLKLCIYCESSGRSRGGPAPPPYCYTKLLHEGLKKIFWTPPTCLSHDLDDQAPPLSEGLDPPRESMLFGFKNPDLNILGKEMHPKI